MSNGSEWYEKLKSDDNPFKIFGLFGNPFPSQPVASLTRYDFNEKIRARELEEISFKFLKPSMKGEATNLWVMGPLGVGKSSLMMHVRDTINKQFGENFIAIYIYSPIAGVASIYRDFVDNLTTAGMMNNIVSRLIVKALKANPSLIVEKKGLKITKRSALDEESLNAVVEEREFDFSRVVSHIKKELNRKFPYINLKIVDLFLDYFKEPESVENIRNISASDKLNTLIGFIHLITIADFKMVYLFIDQLEMGWGKWTKTQKDRFAIDIRELVVRTTPLLSVEITCNEDIISDLETNYPQLLRPLPKKSHTEVYVSLFNFPAIKSLIGWYLDKQRTNRDGTLAPFDEEAVKQIYERTARNTYEILSACYGLLNFAAKDKVNPITQEYAINHLERKDGSST